VRCTLSEGVKEELRRWLLELNSRIAGQESKMQKAREAGKEHGAKNKSKGAGRKKAKDKKSKGQIGLL